MGKFELFLETDKVCMYSPKYDGETQNEFEKFLYANNSHSHPQLKRFFDAIISVIEKMSETGAYERYFRPEGGNIKAVPLYINTTKIDKKVGKMRLYCLRLSERMLILGQENLHLSSKLVIKYQNELDNIQENIKRIEKLLEQKNDDIS
jgi:hypothetical protein